MANADLERANELKKNLVNFVYDAEGDLAIALETYVAQQGSRDRAGYDIRQQNLVFDTFLSEGIVNEQTTLELFLENQSDLTKQDCALIKGWQNSFTGLFEVIKIPPQGFEVMNWLTAKHYTVFPSSEVPESDTKRWQPEDIILTRIAPINEKEWMFSGASILKGNLGKPKLAVALGEFKKNYPNCLYSDAPELLEQAWESVTTYHEEFVEFFGRDRVTLSGYQLNKKLSELQEKMRQKRFADAGIDSSKSLQEIAKEKGIDEEDMKAAATEAGVDAATVAKTLESKLNSPMVTPDVALPDRIKKAENATAFSHPRWGQTILPTYHKFTTILEAEEPQENEEAIVKKYLEDPQINYFIWQQLKSEFPTQLETKIQKILQRPDFNLDRDLEALLLEFNKPLEPELPEIASVPLHLHNLFEEAVARVNKSKSKKKKKKAVKGFK
ncbi:hypothetical protein IQ249_09750 [Lusitaniella coriacea LEGE 07157]|uniref:Uncharacterized protein n=1 Tax=Lusitaniella coriacea LEGE 07157 TaxID=945747 RepID=A0A8J7DWM7_9CYAN|nr:hypothetical protein [Lusitaniella coriacea]MBE9116178.1 hypothetical protein [Lusitaniella coriacea LEGE 07157]